MPRDVRYNVWGAMANLTPMEQQNAKRLEDRTVTQDEAITSAAAHVRRYPKRDAWVETVGGKTTFSAARIRRLVSIQAAKP